MLRGVALPQSPVRQLSLLSLTAPTTTVGQVRCGREAVGLRPALPEGVPCGCGPQREAQLSWPRPLPCRSRAPW